MKHLKLLIVLALCGSFAACLGSSETDLADLQNSNDIVKRRAITKYSKPKPFPLNFFSRRAEKRAVDVLLKMLIEGQENEDIQISIIAALGDLGRRNAVPVAPIIAELKDENKNIRLQSVEALGKIQNKEAVPALIELMETEKDEYSIIWALGEIGDKRAITALNPLLASEDEYVRYNARKALKKIQ